MPNPAFWLLFGPLPSWKLLVAGVCTLPSTNVGLTFQTLNTPDSLTCSINVTTLAILAADCRTCPPFVCREREN
ncbi:hypothetical protein GQ43DRAFT_439028 [Delitschia confertaspora ATCC 74209]|uniref:Secreted protein n=1 Tax=Delitschia confertaspora ATCC 74209 TaxID=1513339 RepID=A0A9P4JP96_9PLEO|nr:hypothetical protein GQ43DRAFT_439028 [Delitschia confertaspora ATCC 74209]